MGSKKIGGKKSVPIGVKIISILFYIVATITMISSLITIGTLIIGGPVEETPGLEEIGLGFSVLMEIIYIAFSVLYILVGIGLWKARPWSRIVAIVLSVLGIVGSVILIVTMPEATIYDAISYSISMVVYLVIGGYLLFSSKVKEAFA